MEVQGSLEVGYRATVPDGRPQVNWYDQYARDRADGVGARAPYCASGGRRDDVGTSEEQDDQSHPGPSGDTGSRARDHMANERTFLAWLRTGGTVMALGLAVAQLNRLPDTSNAIISGGILVIVGAAGVLHGAARYSRVNDQLSEQRYVTGARGREAMIAAGVLIAAIVGAFVLLML